MEKAHNFSVDTFIQEHSLWLQFKEGKRAEIYSDISNLDFSNAYLRQALFGNCNIDKCNFSNADLTYSFFTSANLSGCDFSFACVSDSCIASSDFSKTNLSYVNFKNTAFSFYNSSFKEANIYGTNFGEGIIPVINEVAPEVHHFDYVILKSRINIGSYNSIFYYIMSAEGESLNDIFSIKDDELRSFLIKNMDNISFCDHKEAISMRSDKNVEEYIEHLKSRQAMYKMFW